MYKTALTMIDVKGGIFGTVATTDLVAERFARRKRSEEKRSRPVQ